MASEEPNPIEAPPSAAEDAAAPVGASAEFPAASTAAAVQTAATNIDPIKAGIASLPPIKGEGGAWSGRGIIIGLASIWAIAGLWVAPVETLIWITSVLLIVCCAVLWARHLDQRVYSRVEKGRCAECGYDLQGSGPSGQCPECGCWFGPGWGAAIPKRKTTKRPDAPPSAEPAPASQSDTRAA